MKIVCGVRSRCLARRVLAAALLLTACTGLAWALQPKGESALGAKEFFLPELYLSSSHLAVDEVLDQLPNRGAWEGYRAELRAGDFAQLGAYIDPRSGAVTGLVDLGPILPGAGIGNNLTLEELSGRLGYGVGDIGPEVVADAVLEFVSRHLDLLGVDGRQLGELRAVQVSPELWQVRIPQVYRGVPVRYGHMVATIRGGNLLLLGSEAWGNVRGLSEVPDITAETALQAGFGYAGGRTALDQVVVRPSLEIVPVAPPEHQVAEGFVGLIGAGYRHRLVWTFSFRRLPEQAVWEVMVDAHDGQVIAFQDTNQYAGEQITGGVYPVTSTEICPTDGTCGIMQSGWPMPWADTGRPSPNNFTDGSGVFDATGGTATTTLTGRYVDIVDNCGGISNSAQGSIDLGGNNGDHNCTTGGGSAGNTPASRTAFYELNKLAEQARGWLPGNAWLQNRLTSNVNINLTCNAFWNGSSVNFYRSGGGCRNTGELAGVFDHEWGHGLDDNDAGGALSNSSEAYADIAAIYRLQTSCIGHGFFQTLNDGCGLTADGTGYNADEAQVGSPVCCTDCSGVRDADYAKHVPATPATALGFVCNSCSNSSGPCGRQVHCAAAPSRQAAWDFVARDLAGAPYNLDSQSAFIVGNKVFYEGSGSIGAWHACTCGVSSDGCGASNAYMQWLAADDDDGSLANGTPHMTALYNAFNRHGIACSTPTPQDGGCAAGPSAAPTLAASAGNRQVSLSWNGVAGASEYWVMRSEGHAACDFGKTRIATVTGTSFTDSEVANGRDYSYNVVAAGSSDACFGPVSNCATVAPAGAPDFAVSCTPASHTIQQGASAQSTCTVSSVGGFSGAVTLSCSGNPGGVGCSFVPGSVTPPVDGSSDSTLTLTVDLGQAPGNYGFDVVGTSGALVHTSGMAVNVVPEGTNGPQDAVFNATYQAPTCLIPGSSCDSVALLDGRANLGPEVNQPNTINDSCADGTSGAYHSDESNDRILVSTLDGSDFTEGATVRIDATVWAWSSGSSDTLDLYHAADATNPTWVYVGSIVPPAGGAQTLSAQYVLPAGGLQAVRANFRYLGSASSCSTGTYDDHDDLVFAVNAAGPQCVTDPDCDDGLYCNGAEVCNAGTCQAGTAPDCADGVGCTVDSCNEASDSCDNTPDDGLCSNGLFCDGTETCDAVLDCQAGTAVDCADGVSCTDDSCNEGSDSCDHVPNDGLCSNGLFCDGAETCDAVLGCQAGTAVDCGDGVGCTIDSCNEGSDSCDHVATDALCDNGLFCDGSEVCNPVLDCQAGGDPCPGQSCDEGSDSCVACVIDADCNDGLYCNGAEVCNAGTCMAGPPVDCTDGVGCTVDSCNEASDSCDNTPNDSLCDNGLFCDGSETCDAILDCQAGSDPCSPLGCDEVGDICLGGSNPKVWMSFKTNASIPGVGTVTDEDIVSYDEVTGQWALEFDGSDVGLGALEIDGMAVLPGGDVLLSFTAAATIGGLSVDDSDIVRFTPTSMGSVTAGTFSMYFDGSDVGLTTSGEDVDSIGLASDGRLIISTSGSVSANGASGNDEDLLIFTGTLGANTSGSFALYFDGSDVGLDTSSSEDVDAAGMTSAGTLLFSTLGTFSVSGLSGEGEDVVEFTGTFGPTTAGTFSMRHDLSAMGIDPTEDIGSLHLVE